MAEKTGLKGVTDRLGVSHGMNSLFLKLLDIREEIRFAHFRRTVNINAASLKITAAVLTVDPSKHLSKCIGSLHAQNLPPSRIEIIRNVSPFSKASQEALDRITTEFYVQVDDDMILKPSCFARLYFLITTEGLCAQSVAQLEDPLFGTITGVKMYRTEPVLSIGFHPFEAEKGCERFMTRELLSRGFITARTRSIEGVHHPEYSPFDAYWKFHFLGEQLQYYDDARHKVADLVDILAKRWAAQGDDLILYGLAGLFSGLQSEFPGEELDYEKRGNCSSFNRLQEFFDKKSP
jgi:hypothetical protein